MGTPSESSASFELEGLLQRASRNRVGPAVAEHLRLIMRVLKAMFWVLTCSPGYREGRGRDVLGTPGASQESTSAF